MSPPDDLSLIELGLLDPDDPDRTGTAGYVRLLLDRGGTVEEIREAVAAGRHYMNSLAAELLLCPPGERLSLYDAAAAASVEPAIAAEWWRAMGLPDPVGAAVTFGPADVEVLRFLGGLSAFVGIDTTQDLARVLGSSVGQLAAAGVNALRLGFEAPMREAGAGDATIADAYAAVIADVLPTLVASFETLLRRHLVGSTYDGVVVADGAVTSELAVVFVDIAGYTAFAQANGPAALAATLTAFEAAAAAAAATHGGRLVKLLGDGAMLTFGDPVAAAAAARQLVARATTAGGPAARAGVAWGSVLARQGDFYGPVVNLAARLAALGEPGKVILDGAVGPAVASKAMPAVELKGIAEPVVAYVAD